METKPSNPKDQVGVLKAPMHYVSMPYMFEVGLAMLEGGLKYGAHNYRVAGVRYSVYYDAILRHVAAIWEGQDIDPDSGLPHLAKIGACCAVLRDAELCGKLVDDRPPAVHQDWIASLNQKAKELIARYPEPKAPFTQKENHE